MVFAPFINTPARISGAFSGVVRNETCSEPLYPRVLSGADFDDLVSGVKEIRLLTRRCTPWVRSQASNIADFCARARCTEGMSLSLMEIATEISAAVFGMRVLATAAVLMSVAQLAGFVAQGSVARSADCAETVTGTASSAVRRVRLKRVKGSLLE